MPPVRARSILALTLKTLTGTALSSIIITIHHERASAWHFLATPLHHMPQARARWRHA